MRRDQRVLRIAILLLSLVVSVSFPFAQRRSAQSASLSITGRVIEQDGTPPRELVQVNLICNGRIRQQILTAADGTFAMDLDSTNDEAWLDPGLGGSADGAMEGTAKVNRGSRSGNLDEVPSMGRGRVTLAGCEVRVAPQPGLAAEAISLRTRGSLDNPDIGTIVLHRLSDSAATLVSVTSLSAPKKAKEAFDKGNAALTAEKPNVAKAIKELTKAVKEYPGYSEAWDLLARANLAQGNAEEGRRCFQQAIDAEPKYLSPYLGIAQVAVHEGNWAEVRVWSSKVLELHSSHPQALYWNGMGNYYSGAFTEAAKSLEALYAAGYHERFPFGLLQLGVIHANQGQIQAAATELSLYLRLMPAAEVPEAQRIELQKQIDAWVSEGLAVLPPPADAATDQTP